MGPQPVVPAVGVERGQPAAPPHLDGEALDVAPALGAAPQQERRGVVQPDPARALGGRGEDHRVEAHRRQPGVGMEEVAAAQGLLAHDQLLGDEVVPAVEQRELHRDAVGAVPALALGHAGARLQRHRQGCDVHDVVGDDDVEEHRHRRVARGLEHALVVPSRGGRRPGWRRCGCARAPTARSSPPARWWSCRARAPPRRRAAWPRPRRAGPPRARGPTRARSWRGV